MCKIRARDPRKEKRGSDQEVENDLGGRGLTMPQILLLSGRIRQKGLDRCSGSWTKSRLKKKNWAELIAQQGGHLPYTQQTRVQSLASHRAPKAYQE